MLGKNLCYDFYMADSQKNTTNQQSNTSAAPSQNTTQPLAGQLVKPALPASPTGSLFKEGAPIAAEKKGFEPAPEVKKWVTEIKEPEDINLPKPIMDEFGQVLMESAMPPKPKITLPLTKQQSNTAIHKKIIESVRWLAEWCLRIFKMFPDRVNYKTDGSNNSVK